MRRWSPKHGRLLKACPASSQPLITHRPNANLVPAGRPLQAHSCTHCPKQAGTPPVGRGAAVAAGNGSGQPKSSTTICRHCGRRPAFPPRAPLAPSLPHARYRHKDLPAILAQGVPTGVFEPIASSHQWPAVEAQHAQHPLDTCLKEFDTNWKNAEAQPELLQRLIEEEMAQGWVIEIPDGGEQEARAQWPKGIAIGKLNVVQAEGKESRMVPDSSVCNVNPRCTLHERVCLPTCADVRTTFKPRRTPQTPRRAPRSTSRPPISESRSANRTKASCSSETQAAYTPMWYAISEHAFQPSGGSALEHCS